MQNLFDQPLFVLGLPRSGTSMVAGVLKKSGFWCGSTVAGDNNNPKGYFENTFIRERIVKRLLAELGCDPLGVRSLPEPENLRSAFDIRREIGKILKTEGYRGSRPWLYKDAKLTLLWPLFAQSFPGACWLYVARDQDSFVDSCLRTSFMRQHSSDAGYWQDFAASYLQRIDALRAHSEHFYEVDSREILRGETAGLETVLNDYNLQFDPKKIQRFVDRSHWHGAVDADTSGAQEGRGA